MDNVGEDAMTGQVVIDLSSGYRTRAGRLRVRARVADAARAQELLLLAEEYEFRAERLERRRAAMRNAIAPVPEKTATESPVELVPEPSLVE
jgi:hypothetical protein